MPIIRVDMFKGRSREQKRALIKEVTDAFLRTCGGTPQSVQVVITDVDKEDWGAAGEMMADKYPDK
jgi:4-oxalocrotonate tautomerase